MKQLIIESNSVSEGYALIDQLDKKFSLNIYEASLAASPAFWILAEASPKNEEAVKQYLVSCKKEGVHFHFCNSGEEKLKLKMVLFGLAPQKIKSYIGMIEAHSLVSLVVALDDLLLETDLQIIDLQPARSAGGVSLAFFTGEVLPEKNRLQDLKQNKVIINYALIDKPGNVFAAHFSI